MMAGDWIKMRTDLKDDPAVISAALKLGVEEDLIVGKLHRFWSWANLQTRDGNAPGVTPEWVDRYVSLPGFASALANTGWLNASESGIAVPNFPKHNGQSGKQRALTSSRVAAHRATKTPECNGDTVTESLPEKRREEKEKITIPTPMGDDACAGARHEDSNGVIPALSPAMLAQRFCFSSLCHFSSKEKDEIFMASQFSEWIRVGLCTAEQISAELDRKERDRCQREFEFKKVFEKKPTGKMTNGRTRQSSRFVENG